MTQTLNLSDPNWGKMEGQPMGASGSSSGASTGKRTVKKYRAGKSCEDHVIKL
jgi:hypothetical protein